MRRLGTPAVTRDLRQRPLGTQSSLSASLCGLREIVRDHRPGSDSRLLLSVDVVSAKVLVWFARVGRDGELTPEAHLYFFDRYQRLAECHRRRGDVKRTRRFQAKAEEHRQMAGGTDGPPYAAAMAMPRPGRFTRVNAVGAAGSDPPDDAA